MKVTTHREIAGRHYELAFYDGFTGPELDTRRWHPYYLPQWSSKEAASARYRLQEQSLQLLIAPDQQPWCPEFNGQVRFNPACVVREAQPTQHLYTPHHGFIEFRARCRLSPNHVAALWMIGLEEQPEQSAEICIFELKGQHVEPQSAIIGYGLHPFGDPAIRDEFFEEPMALDVSQYHSYAVEWLKEAIHFYIDGRCIRTLNQSPDYAMQLMLNLYDLANLPDEPGLFQIDYLAGYQPTKQKSNKIK